MLSPPAVGRHNIPQDCNTEVTREPVTMHRLKLQTIHRFSQSRKRPLLGSSTGWKRLLVLSHLRHYWDSWDTMLIKALVGAFSAIVKTDRSFAALAQMQSKYRGAELGRRQELAFKLLFYHEISPACNRGVCDMMWGDTCCYKHEYREH